MPRDEVVSEIEGRVRSAEVVEPYRSYRTPIRGECFERWTAAIVVCDEVAEVFQILSPIVIGIGCDHIAVFGTAGEHVVVGEIAWIDGERSDEEQTEEECGERSEDISEVFLVPMVEIGRGFGGEKVEERENRKEVAETDIEIAGDADEGIKENEEYREILSGAVLERGHEGREEIGSGPAFDGADDAEERIRGCDQDKEEKGECFLQAEDDGKVVW